MRTLIFLLLAFLLVGCTVAAAPSQRGLERGRGHHRAAPTSTPSCQTEITQATLSGTSSIQLTVSPGDALFLRMATALNWTDGQQWWTTTVGYFSNQPEARLPAEWITFDPAQFCLEVGGYEQVDIWLAVPPSAKADTYFGLLEFDVCKDNSCAAVAIRATITVE